MPKGIPLSNDEYQSRRKKIMDTSIQLIVDKGYNETSLKEIAASAGIGKSTFYDYFRSKEEVLVTYILEEVQVLNDNLTQVNAQEIKASEKIRLLMRKHLDYLVSNKQRSLKISYEAQRLGSDSIAQIQQARHAYQDRLCEIIRQGIQDSEFRPVNPLLAIRGMFAILSAAVFTTRPTGSPDEMTMESFDIIFKGLEA
jgi:AcrR family transcriptional regulator